MKYHTNECRKRFLENKIQTINILRSEKWEEEKLTKWKEKKNTYIALNRFGGDMIHG